MLDEYCLVLSDHICLTPWLFHYLWFRITDVHHGVKVMITSGWEGSKRINRGNNCNSNTLWETWKMFCGLLLPKPCQQSAEVGRWLAWKKALELEHLSVCSSWNTNPLKNKRGKKFFHGQRIWETLYTLSSHATLEIYTTKDSEIPAIKERPKK